jgi:hypothetical protein
MRLTILSNKRWLCLGLLLWLGIGSTASQANDTYIEAITAELKIARSNLAISQKRLDDAASQIERLRESGHSGPETIADARLYIERIRAMVQENQVWVSRLEALYTEYTGNPPPAGQRDQMVAPMMDPAIPEEGVSDEITALDRALDDSLAEFDERLLQELALMRRQSGEKMSDLAAEAAAAARRLEEKGIDLGREDQSGQQTGPKGAAGERPEQPSTHGDPSGEPPQGTDDGLEGEETGIDGRRTDHGPDGTQSPTKRSGDRYTGEEDDDIVARQLREAAEKETDPELKEKLWKEYETYKKNQQ